MERCFNKWLELKVRSEEMSKKGSIIVIEGTDCSGKETQTKMLVKKLKAIGEEVYLQGFPVYDSPTGKIVGGPLLGKSYISEGWFPEGASHVDPLVFSLLMAADRLYNIGEIKKNLKEGKVVILDRYTISNMAHQGSKKDTKEERLILYKKLELLEYDFAELPRPDMVLFLYMPFEYGEILREKRSKIEALDQNESDKEHLLRAEKTYLELAQLYNFVTVNCVRNDSIRSIEDINNEVYEKVEKYLELKRKN